MTSQTTVDGTGRRFIIHLCSGLALFYFWPRSRSMSSQETSRGDHMSTNRLSLRHFDKESPMIRTEIISPNSLRILVPEKLKADDFRHIAPQVDAIIGQYGKIRLLI